MCIDSIASHLVQPISAASNALQPDRAISQGVMGAGSQAAASDDALRLFDLHAGVVAHALRRMRLQQGPLTEARPDEPLGRAPVRWQ